MQAGDRSAAAIDAGASLPGLDGVLVRDGYAGYAHLVRNPRGVYDGEPERQLWTQAMADTLLAANVSAQQAKEAGAAVIEPVALDRIHDHYRGAVAKGVADNTGCTGRLAHEALTLARRFRDNEAMILRFATDLTSFTNSEAGRACRPVKVQQRSSGGCWRTVDGLGYFAIGRSYLSTARKRGRDSLEVLCQLFTAGGLAAASSRGTYLDGYFKSSAANRTGESG